MAGPGRVELASEAPRLSGAIFLTNVERRQPIKGVVGFRPPTGAASPTLHRVDIDDLYRYFEGGLFMANRLLTFLRIEHSPLIGQLLLGLLDYWIATRFQGRAIFPDYDLVEDEIGKFCAIDDRFTGGATTKGGSMRRYRVALSFAGEKRQFVGGVARFLAGYLGEEKSATTSSPRQNTREEILVFTSPNFTKPTPNSLLLSYAPTKTERCRLALSGLRSTTF